MTSGQADGAGEGPAGAGGGAREAGDDPASAPPDHGEGFTLRLPAFEGPLDLLLHLIERQELDVTEVSLLTVTEQYLAHLRAGEQVNLSALADFVAVGARLLLLKSRALLPRDESDEPEDAEDGDAAGLVAALHEYRRYRRAAEHLHALEEEHRTGYRREAAAPETQLPSGLDRTTLDALVELFRDVLGRLPEQPQAAEVEREPVRLADRVASLVETLEREGRVPFRGLVERATTRLEVIIDFLAVLELIKARFLEARQSDAFGEIELVRLEGARAPTASDLAGDFDAV